MANEACINIPCVGTVTAGDTIEAAALSLSIRVSSPRGLRRYQSTSHSAAAASRILGSRLRSSLSIQVWMVNGNEPI